MELGAYTRQGAVSQAVPVAHQVSLPRCAVNTGALTGGVLS
jgi:hypothetical protein